MDNERDSLGGFHMRIAAFDAGCANAAAEQDAPPTKDGGINPKGSKAGAHCAPYNVVGSSGEKAGAIKRMDNERDSLCGFHMRIATFDAGWVNAAVGQDINREKGWCAVRTLHNDRTLHNVHPTTTITIRRHFVQYQ